MLYIRGRSRHLRRGKIPATLMGSRDIIGPAKALTSSLTGQKRLNGSSGYCGEKGGLFAAPIFFI